MTSVDIATFLKMESSHVDFKEKLESSILSNEKKHCRMKIVDRIVDRKKKKLGFIE